MKRLPATHWPLICSLFVGALCFDAAAATRANGKTQAHPHKQAGKASIYAGKFSGRKMADGTRMDPKAHVAASKTLPLGSKARVTNRKTGESTTVTIRDRGPYVKGRVVDLSPAAARDVGVTKKQGLGDVSVTPLTPSAPTGAARSRRG